MVAMKIILRLGAHHNMKVCSIRKELRTSALWSGDWLKLTEFYSFTCLSFPPPPCAGIKSLSHHSRPRVSLFWMEIGDILLGGHWPHRGNSSPSAVLLVCWRAMRLYSILCHALTLCDWWQDTLCSCSLTEGNLMGPRECTNLGE